MTVTSGSIFRPRGNIPRPHFPSRLRLAFILDFFLNNELDEAGGLCAALQICVLSFSRQLVSLQEEGLRSPPVPQPHITFAETSLSVV